MKNEIKETPETTESSRRAFLRHTCGLLAVIGGGALLAACDSGESINLEGITVTGNTMTIDLTKQTALAAVGGSLYYQAKRVVIIHLASGYKAFSSVCPHEQENVKEFDGTKLTCPTHGWTFNPTTGANTVNGRGGLSSKTTALNENILTVNL